MPAKSTTNPDSFTAATDAWHAERIDKLTAPDGWLSLVGLLWLEEGTNTVGRSRDAQIHYAGFPRDIVGTMQVRGRVVTFEPAAGLTFEGLPVDHRLRIDAEGSPTILMLGDIRFYVILRGGRLAVRIKDAAAQTRTTFTGIDRYPADPAWRITARFVPETSTTTVDTVINTQETTTIVGRARFEYAGHQVNAALYQGGTNTCYLRFADATNGDTTYPVGRYLLIDLPPHDGTITLDFNRAYSPPCAFTPYATCDIPIASNRFPFPVTAGEQWQGDH